jgi:hypothetical protein
MTINPEKFLDYTTIKSHTFLHKDLVTKTEYQIIKERYTGAWIICLSNLIVLYIDKEDYINFIETYHDSKNYKFHVYETPLYYIVFCVSHLKNETTDMTNFLIRNWCNLQYTLLTQEFQSFIVLNTSYNVKHFHDFDYFKFKMSLGEGEYKLSILECISFILSLRKNCKHLPEHYLMIT